MVTPWHKLVLEGQLTIKQQRHSSKGLTKGCWGRAAESKQKPDRVLISLSRFGATALVAMSTGHVKNPWSAWNTQATCLFWRT